VPIANEKTEGPTTILEYLGLTIDTQNMVVKIPADKVKELLNQIKTVASAKKVTFKQLQSLCGLLAFCTKALPFNGNLRYIIIKMRLLTFVLNAL
jgi:hypothetical protein